MGSFPLLEHPAESVKALFDGLSVYLYPLVEVVKAVHARLALAHTAVLAGIDQASVLQQPNVLLHAGERHSQQLGKLADRGTAVAQPLQDGAPRWVRERGQRPVNRLLLNHTVQYARARDCVKHSGDTRRVSGPPRLLVIIGSGEMAPQMGRVHRSVISALAAAHDVPRPVRGTIVDTPYGFQENANALSAEALDYFGRRLGLDMTLAAMPRSDGDLLAREAAYARIREAEFVFSGPGSPSYALGQWRQSEIPTLFAEKLIAGGALVVASAAALTLGRLTAPVYEIYKAGEDPYWLPGLDVLAAVGISRSSISSRRLPRKQ